jgi:hypothetical protein
LAWHFKAFNHVKFIQNPAAYGTLPIFVILFPNMLIETTAPEESCFPIQHRSSDLTWSRKKKDYADGNERFFVDQWSVKAVLSRKMQKHSFCTPYCNLMLGSSERHSVIPDLQLNLAHMSEGWAPSEAFSAIQVVTQ